MDADQLRPRAVANDASELPHLGAPKECRPSASGSGVPDGLVLLARLLGRQAAEEWMKSASSPSSEKKASK